MGFWICLLVVYVSELPSHYIIGNSFPWLNLEKYICLLVSRGIFHLKSSFATFPWSRRPCDSFHLWIWRWKGPMCDSHAMLCYYHSLSILAVMELSLVVSFFVLILLPYFEKIWAQDLQLLTSNTNWALIRVLKFVYMLLLTSYGFFPLLSLIFMVQSLIIAFHVISWILQFTISVPLLFSSC